MDDKRDSRCRKILILRWSSLLIANNLSVENGTVTLNDHFVPIAIQKRDRQAPVVTKGS